LLDGVAHAFIKYQDVLSGCKGRDYAGNGADVVTAAAAAAAAATAQQKRME
jgi:hypothetical protein